MFLIYRYQRKIFLYNLSYQPILAQFDQKILAQIQRLGNISIICQQLALKKYLFAGIRNFIQYKLLKFDQVIRQIISVNYFNLSAILLFASFIIQIRQKQMQSCPVMHPSHEEFNDFYNYIHQLDKKYKSDYGMVKIVPPTGWRPQSKNYLQRLENLIVKNPIEQNVQGTAGFYESKNIVQNKMSFKAYRKYAEDENAKVEGKTESQKEKMFWKTITYSPPIYGADLTGTLMDESAAEWNFNNLNSLLKYALTDKVKGVTEPYCYIGSWKTFFSWHKQDLDLAAINYIHQGASKVWYSIAKDHCHILQEEASSQFKQHSRKCSQFLRHKTFLINPELLLRKHPDLKVSRVEHKAGQIMIVFGGAYHCGFNCGFNIAEAVNYATIDWLKELTTVQFCTCFRKSVKGEIQSILYNLENSSIYEQLSKSQQFQILQNFVYYMQLNEEKNESQCPVKDKNRNDQNQNINTVNEIMEIKQKELQKQEAQVQLVKGKDSKKIKKELKDKEKTKKKTRNQPLKSPPKNYFIKPNQKPFFAQNNKKSFVIQSTKQVNPLQGGQILKRSQDGHSMNSQ